MQGYNVVVRAKPPHLTSLVFHKGVSHLQVQRQRERLWEEIVGLGEHLLDLLEIAGHRPLAAQLEHPVEVVDFLSEWGRLNCDFRPFGWLPTPIALPESW